MQLILCEISRKRLCSNELRCGNCRFDECCDLRSEVRNDSRLSYQLVNLFEYVQQRLYRLLLKNKSKRRKRIAFENREANVSKFVAAEFVFLYFFIPCSQAVSKFPKIIYKQSINRQISKLRVIITVSGRLWMHKTDVG